METGLSIDLVSQGYVAIEVPCDLRHRASGTDLKGQLHRAAQYRDVLLAVNARKVRSVAHGVGRRIGRPLGHVALAGAYRPSALWTALRVGRCAARPAGPARRTRLAASADGAVAAQGSVPASARRSAHRPGPVLGRGRLVGTGDLHWTDIDRTATPTLWRLVSTGSVGSVSVRTAGAQTCPVDAWLTVSAGRRTVAPTPGASGEDLPLDCVPMPQVEASGTGATRSRGGGRLGRAESPRCDRRRRDSRTAPRVARPRGWGCPGALGELVSATGVVLDRGRARVRRSPWPTRTAPSTATSTSRRA